MSVSARLGILFLAPALIFVTLFFFAPVVLTGVFSFTNMSTATGITGGAYQVTSNVLRQLADEGFEKSTLDRLGAKSYVVSAQALVAATTEGVVDKAVLVELESKHLGKTYQSRRDFERFLKKLKNRPRSTRDLKKISPYFRASLMGQRFESEEVLFAMLASLDLGLPDPQMRHVARASYTGWVWGTGNFKRMFSLGDNLRVLRNTGIYVVATLLLFNTGFALVLAIATFYLPGRHSAFFRGLWLLPRITPPVLYVLLWKWLAWDTDFFNTILANFDIQSRNWMLDTGANAWLFVVLINGFVGASMGMIIFASAIKAIPQTMLHASEVDGANRWQQIRHIILPQIKWPIMFITVYQTLSLLTSFEYIWLSTDGGPGTSTEVWALAAFHAALDNYWGNLQYGYGAALALVLVVIGVVMSLIYLRLFNFDALITRPRIEQ